MLGIWVQAAEGAKFWAGVCAELANRGVKDVLILACDGLTGFPEAIAAAPRPIYTAVNEDSALEALDAFEKSQWGQKYPATLAAWQRAWDRFIPFLAFGPATRKAIYTTNSIESLNYQLRKIIKTRGHFPSDAAAVKLMWLAITNIEDKRARQRAKQAGLPKGNPRKASGKLIEGLAIQGWQKVLGELALHYPDRFPTTI